MLARLERLHAEFVDALAGLNGLVRASAPSREAIAEARLRLMHTTIAHTKYMELDVYPTVFRALSPVEAEPIRELRRRAIAVRIELSRHIATWPIERVIRDWAGFQETTIRADLNRGMRAQLHALLPILSREDFGGEAVAEAA